MNSLMAFLNPGKVTSPDSGYQKICQAKQKVRSSRREQPRANFQYGTQGVVSILRHFTDAKPLGFKEIFIIFPPAEYEDTSVIAVTTPYVVYKIPSTTFSYGRQDCATSRHE